MVSHHLQLLSNKNMPTSSKFSLSVLRRFHCNDHAVFFVYVFVILPIVQGGSKFLKTQTKMWYKSATTQQLIFKFSKMFGQCLGTWCWHVQEQMMMTIMTFLPNFLHISLYSLIYNHITQLLQFACKTLRNHQQLACNENSSSSVQEDIQTVCHQQLQ